MDADLSRDLIDRLKELRGLCPDMRFGQLLATLGFLSEDTAGRSLWDVEDDELVEVLEHFREDLARRELVAERRRQETVTRAELEQDIDRRSGAE
jgi:hypothetical protein